MLDMTDADLEHIDDGIDWDELERKAKQQPEVATSCSA